jgi:hypothetical protein
MVELSRYLFLAGTVPFILLGAMHAFLTPRKPDRSRALSPRDATLRDAMTRETIFLTRRTTLWLAWVGFNLSHSLGAVLFGSAMLLVARSESSFQQQAGVFLPFAVLVGATYLWLAIRYWFRTPIIGIALSETFFVASWVLFAVR